MCISLNYLANREFILYSQQTANTNSDVTARWPAEMINNTFPQIRKHADRI